MYVCGGQRVLLFGVQLIILILATSMYKVCVRVYTMHVVYSYDVWYGGVKL